MQVLKDSSTDRIISATIYVMILAFTSLSRFLVVPRKGDGFEDVFFFFFFRGTVCFLGVLVFALSLFG